MSMTDANLYYEQSVKYVESNDLSAMLVINAVFALSRSLHR
jgi:hypothetical protein